MPIRQFSVTSWSPSHNYSSLVDVLVRIGTCWWQNSGTNIIRKNHGHVQWNDGDIIGLQSTGHLKKKHKVSNHEGKRCVNNINVVLNVLTYIAGGIVSAVNDNSADSPSHMDDWWRRDCWFSVSSRTSSCHCRCDWSQTNQNGHSRNFIHGQSL